MGSGRAQLYDVLVLGGGTAGCVLAARLSDGSESSVCLVEGGPNASIMPTIPRANTNLTTIATAERIAERLAR
jgi:choline dehydrogenase-like flavoprotein